MLTYLIPVIVFILVSLVAIFASVIWQKYLSFKTKKIQTRIEDIKSNLPKFENLLMKSAEQSNNDLVVFLKKRIPYLEKLKMTLIRSGLEKTIDEILMLVILGLILTFMVLIILTSLSFFIIILFALLVGSLPIIYLYRRADQRRIQFEEQLPDALDFLSRALKAGHGMSSAIGMLADEFSGQIAKEFKVTFDELNFGLPFGEAMSNLSYRVNSADLSFFVIALSIQRETGGNLTELLENLAKTIRERMKLGGRVKVLSAEGKYSGILLGVFPFILAGGLSLINPKYMSILWTTETGKNLIAIGFVMMALGGFWMSKIVKIRV